MISDKKLSTIRADLRKKLAAEEANPIAMLDRRLRQLRNGSKGKAKASRAVNLLRGALSQLRQDKPRQRARTKPSLEKRHAQ